MFGSESLNLGGNIYGAAEHMKTISMNICNVCDYCDIYAREKADKAIQLRGQILNVLSLLTNSMVK